MRWYDSQFYALHDEWYWYTLLNGASTAGDDFFTPLPGSFPSVESIYDWAGEQPALPFDLRFVAGGERLYSPRFYSIALSVTPRLYGAGTLVHFPARPEADRPEYWAIELGYSDAVGHDEIVVFIDMVLSTVPAAIGDEVKWMVRSAPQETLAQQMESQELQYADRILRYSDVTVAGETQIYAEGLTAGRLLLIGPGESALEDSTSDDILLLAAPPDFLPPAAGLITAVPQTPLAHINVLARNRGIPNAYLAGLFEDPFLDQLVRVRAPVALRAIAPGQLDIVPLSNSDWATWRAISQQPVVTLEEQDFSNAPFTLDLASLDLIDVDDLRPLIGGKAAGFLALLAPGTVIRPEWPLAISARAFSEHLAPLQATLSAALLEQDFRRSLQARVLVLEGEHIYNLRFASEADRAFRDQLLLDHGPGTPLGDLIASGGVSGWIRATPIESSTRDVLEEALRAQFDSFSSAQGLRFRSSSTVEDIEGFNGAGLYTSNTGYLDPAPGKRGFEAASKETWASYWGSEAFEERELAGVEHLLGQMAILVHARFDDDKERSNGVFTLTLLPGDLNDPVFLNAKAQMIVNAQAGALSVTNPPPGSSALPEIDVVMLRNDGSTSIERVRPSSELGLGEVVLSDTQLLEMLTNATAVTEAWLAEENADLLNAQKRRTLTLDFEYREMDSGWPALANGNNFGRRVVIKQARSLEPSLAALPAYVRNHPLPRDVLARARRIERRECTSVDVRLVVVEAFTDPLISPDLGYSAAPFTGFITLDFNRDLPDLGKEGGDRTSLVHLSFSSLLHPGMETGGAWALQGEISELNQEGAGLASIDVNENLVYTLTNPEGGSVSGSFDGCSVDLQYSSPEAFLARIFEDYDAAAD